MKKSGKKYQINEEILIQATIAINISTSDLQLDLNSIELLKKQIIRNLDFYLRQSPGLSPVAYTIDMIDTNTKSSLINKESVKDN